MGEGRYLTAYQAIKEHCKFCMNYKTGEVQRCVATTCYWYDWRFKKPFKGSTLKAIRKYCVEECVGKEDPGYLKRVAECDILDCPLRPFRFGRNPALTGSKKIQK